MAVLALVVLTSLPILAGSTRHASPELKPSPVIAWRTGLPVADADFDGDQAIDSVRLSSNGPDKTVDISFGNRRTREFKFVSNTPGRGMLVARDIDNDGDVDLIWVANPDQRNAVVLLNDGNGVFTEAKDNAAFTSQLSALLGNDDPANEDSLQTAHQFVSLITSAFAHFAILNGIGLPSSTAGTVSLISFGGFSTRAAFHAYLHKRGPPASLF